MAEQEQQPIIGTASTGSWVRWIPWLVLIAAPIFLFYPCTQHDFVNWDNPIYILRNPVLESFSWANIRAVFTPGGIQDELLYIPVTYLSWMMECSLFGKSAAVMHTVNVGLHLCNVGMLYLAFQRLLFSRHASCLGALLFAVHPLQVESVAWVMGRKDLLSMTFALVCLLTYLHFLEGRKNYWFVAALLAFLLAVFAKPSVLVLPAVLLIVDFRIKGRVNRQDLMSKLPFLIVTIGTYVLHLQIDQGSLSSMPALWFRLLCVPWIAWHWAARFFLLEAPIPMYAWPAIEDARHIALFGGAAMLSFLGLLVWTIRKRVDWCWQLMLIFGILFAPAIQMVIAYRDFITADRYGYFPLAFLFLIMGCVPFVMNPTLRRVYLMLFGAWLAGCFVMTSQAVRVWSDSLFVWNRVLDAYPHMTTPRANRANTYAERKMFDHALADYDQVLKQKPDDQTVRKNAGQCWLDIGDSLIAARRWSDAAHAFKEAMTFLPDDERAAFGLRRVVRELASAQLVDNPDNVRAMLNLAVILEQEGNTEEAVNYLQRAAAIDSPLQQEATERLKKIQEGTKK